MTYYTGSEERRKRLRDIPSFPDPWDLLRGMITPDKRTELQSETLLKIKELIEKEGFETAHRVLASALSYGFAQNEKEKYAFGRFPLFRKMLLHHILTNEDSRKIQGNYVDHFYGLKSRTDGSEYIVLEPYGISSEETRKLLDQCDRNGLYFNISGLSQHFPGWTIRIVVGQKRKEDSQEEVSGMKTRRLEEGDA